MDKTTTSYPYMRPVKARETEESASRIHENNNLQIQCHTNVYLKPLGQLYAAMSVDDGQILITEDTGMATLLQSATHTDASRHLKGNTLFGGYIRHKWGHFITESMARMWALERIQGTIDHILMFTDQPNDKSVEGNFREVFRLLGIEDKLVIEDCTVRADRLFVPDIAYEHDVFYSDLQRNTYRRITEAALDNNEPAADFFHKGDKVFLSRTRFRNSKRDSINTELLDAFFLSNGYHVLSPEQLSLTVLIHILHKASSIATVSGTLAHNFVFATDPEDKDFIIIERHGWINDFQLGLDKMMGIHPVHVDGFYLPRLSSSQDNIMLFAPTPQFIDFAHAYGLSGADFADSSTSTRIKELRRFIQRCRRYYGCATGLQPWETESGPSILEALVASQERYAPWINSHLPVSWYDFCTPRFIARFLRHLIRRK